MPAPVATLKQSISPLAKQVHQNVERHGLLPHSNPLTCTLHLSCGIIPVTNLPDLTSYTLGMRRTLLCQTV